MKIEIPATIESTDIVSKINKLDWGNRITVLYEILNRIEWATEAEGKKLTREDKDRIHSWLKRKIEWIRWS